MPTRSDLEQLFERLITDPDIQALSRHFRNSGYVEKVAAGPKAARGRVRGKRRDAGFNVRIVYDDGRSSCGCPRAKKKKGCEHVGALILHVASLLPAEGGDTENLNVSAGQAVEPAPEVFKFLQDLFPGIGPKRAKEVARVFRTVPDLLQATERQFRNLPEIGTWAAQVLHEKLQEYQRFPGGSRPAARTPSDEDAEAVEVDAELALIAGSSPRPRRTMVRATGGPSTNGDAPKARAREAEISGRPLEGRTIQVQQSSSGRVFFRPNDPSDPVWRRILHLLKREHRYDLVASPTHHVWVATSDAFPKLAGRLEAMGAERTSKELVDLPLEGLTLFCDATGRRSRFQAATDGVEEAYPLALEILKSSEEYEWDEAQGHHLILPRDFPRVRTKLADMGALLMRKRLRPMREIVEWKPPSEEEYVEGTPKIRGDPDLTPYLEEPLPDTLRPEVRLHNYQREGVAFIRATGYRAYIGDQPGLGKTLQALVAALYIDGPVLVVCPAGARGVWKKEVESKTKETCHVIQPSPSRRQKDEQTSRYDAKFIVASYDALLSRREEIMSRAYKLVILDEAHYVKNKDAERTKAVHDALGWIPHRILLSGTPVMNRVDEVRKQLEFLHPDEWGNDHWFRRRFVAPLQFGTPEVRKRCLASLREYFRGIMLRRLKVDVLKDLPPRHVLTERVKLNPIWRREYNAEAGQLRDHLMRHKDTAFGDDYETTRGHVMTLRQIASNAKGEAAEEKIREILATPGEKVVVFAYYLQHLETMKKRLEEFNPVMVHGGVADKERQKAVKSFQGDDECRVFLGQLVAAGTALTLTAARHVVFIDLDWNPANHEQAGDRVHRIGQTRDCFLHYLVANNTIEDEVAGLLHSKSVDTSILLDGDEDPAGLFQRRRQNRMVARLALKAAMGDEEAEAEEIASAPEAAAKAKSD